MPEIGTRRLCLRPMTWGELARLWADPDVMRHLPTGKPRSAEATRVEVAC